MLTVHGQLLQMENFVLESILYCKSYEIIFNSHAKDNHDVSLANVRQSNGKNFSENMRLKIVNFSGSF